MNALPTMKSKVDIAIERIKTFCPPEGYHLAFSGGKDSCTIERLSRMAGVPFVAHYGNTTVEPKELRQFIHKYYPEVIWHLPKLSMFQLIVKKGIPPTRRRRFCCEFLKEYLGNGEVVLTGIRHEESSGRANRKMVHPCSKDSTKSFVNPIIDWTSVDVWEFIADENIPYCKLYDEGYKRIGCVMCPLASISNRRMDAQRFPKFYQAYLKAFDKMLKRRIENNKPPTTWHTAQDVMDWWLKNPEPRTPDEQETFGFFTQSMD